MVSYRIDARDEIVWVNDAYDAFACANGADDLAEHSLGESLWTFVSGAETGVIWRDIVAEARRGRTVTVPYRCDSPGLRRFLQMTVAPLGEGGIEFTSLLKRYEVRAPEALLECAPNGEGEPLRSCSWCRRFDVGDWVEVEEAVHRLDLLGAPSPRITHAMCAECSERVRAELSAARLPNVRASD